MSKREFKFSMVLASFMIVSCLTAAIYGLLIPNTTTPWFWFTGTGLFLLAGFAEIFKYTRQ